MGVRVSCTLPRRTTVLCAAAVQTTLLLTAFNVTDWKTGGGGGVAAMPIAALAPARHTED